ncbi:hypothetical protein BWX39_08170 [Prevotella intermedia ATCC 25611 = DSM 20706]|nr:hypothetical protein BWX39_08170 [Prevotella intermedia ATCC 25611 = DSM 20706]SUB95610.1 Uncharacterised protein [Prevotella intermedia]
MAELGSLKCLQQIHTQKENFYVNFFLLTAFGGCFSRKKENIAKNTPILLKDSMVSKDSVEVDLERLSRNCKHRQLYNFSDRYSILQQETDILL